MCGHFFQLNHLFLNFQYLGVRQRINYSEVLNPYPLILKINPKRGTVTIRVLRKPSKVLYFLESSGIMRIRHVWAINFFVWQWLIFMTSGFLKEIEWVKICLILYKFYIWLRASKFEAHKNLFHKKMLYFMDTPVQTKLNLCLVITG